MTVGDVIAFNQVEVGDDELADFGLLESAVLRPQTTIGGVDAYPSIHEKAAALMHSLMRLLRVWGESLRRIGETEGQWWHTEMEMPLLESGMSEADCKRPLGCMILQE